jgi:hypothetical protein
MWKVLTTIEVLLALLVRCLPLSFWRESFFTASFGPETEYEDGDW